MSTAWMRPPVQVEDLRAVGREGSVLLSRRGGRARESHVAPRPRDPRCMRKFCDLPPSPVKTSVLPSGLRPGLAHGELRSAKAERRRMPAKTRWSLTASAAFPLAGCRESSLRPAPARRTGRETVLAEGGGARDHVHLAMPAVLRALGGASRRCSRPLATPVDGAEEAVGHELTWRPGRAPLGDHHDVGELVRFGAGTPASVRRGTRRGPPK